MHEIELTSVVPSFDEYIVLLNNKFGSHTQPDLVASLKRNYDKLSNDNKIKLIKSLRILSDVEEGQAKMPYMNGGKTRRKRHKRKTHRNKSKRKR